MCYKLFFNMLFFNRFNICQNCPTAKNVNKYVQLNQNILLLSDIDDFLLNKSLCVGSHKLFCYSYFSTIFANLLVPPHCPNADLIQHARGGTLISLTLFIIHANVRLSWHTITDWFAYWLVTCWHLRCTVSVRAILLFWGEQARVSSGSRWTKIGV